MNIKRLIGGTVFVLLFLLCSFTELYVIFYFLVICAAISEFFMISKNKKKGYALFYLIVFICGILALAFQTKMNYLTVIYIATLVMLSDSGAYFIGKNFGKHKLSKISPNKTIEGAIGGFVTSIVLTNAIFYLVNLTGIDNQFISQELIQNYQFSDVFAVNLILNVLVVLLGIVGDLFESSVKRKYDVKDSGFIVYGHGGIMDRLDSWILPAILIFIFNIISGG